MEGDPTHFSRQDYVEEAWKIVDEYLASEHPVYPYEPGTWGPKKVEEQLLPPGGWNYPEVVKNK
jgi:glucose-6-phosphate 1-dehydrogenase